MDVSAWKRVGRTIGGTMALLALALVSPAPAADLFDRVDEVYTADRLRHTPYNERVASIAAPAESLFLDELFEIIDEAILLNANIRRWFRSDGVRGLHAEDYLLRMGDLDNRLRALDVPERIRSLPALLAECFALQRRFVNDWHLALEAGRPFDSQLTDEYAYHESLHRSHRLLLKVFGELRALYPDVGEMNHRSFHDRLRAVDFR